MRIILALPLLALAACNVNNDSANDQMTLEYNQQRIEDAAGEGRPGRRGGRLRGRQRRRHHRPGGRRTRSATSTWTSTSPATARAPPANEAARLIRRPRQVEKAAALGKWRLHRGRAYARTGTWGRHPDGRRDSHGDDGRRYSFKPHDWADRGEPAVGMLVDFETHESRALSIFPVPGTSPPPAAPPRPRRPRRPSPTTATSYIAALIAFLLGPLGIHRFYLGRTGSGIAMLLLTCTVIGLLVTVPWAFIDMIRYLVMSDSEFADRYARRR